LLLHHRLSRSVAERFWDGLRTGVARIEPVGGADLERAWAIGRDFASQDFSIIDRTSFAVMLRLGLLRVASFDGGFAVFRYGPRCERAFEIVR
jgi:uncharacterized protein